MVFIIIVIISYPVKMFELLLLLMSLLSPITANYTLPVVREACFCISNMQLMNGLKRKSLFRLGKKKNAPSC